MHKLKLLCLVLLGSCTSNNLLKSQAISEKTNLTVTEDTATSARLLDVWELIFADEFNKEGNFDSLKWSFAPRWHPAWAKYLTELPAYARQTGGNLLLTMDNQAIADDPVPYHSGGIQTTEKFNFTYGKVEVRAKFKQGRGSWPAIWMMPEVPVAYGDWPNSGEIDIMEHVNMEPVVHQTIHNATATDENGGSTASKTTGYNINEFNTYNIEWEAHKIDFYVNGVLTYTYHKPTDATSSNWPFDKPFYLILNQSGGAGWPGLITDDDLPFEMAVDYVRVYKKRDI